MNIKTEVLSTGYERTPALWFLLALVVYFACLRPAWADIAILQQFDGIANPNLTGLAPGLHRIVLEQSGGDRSFHDDLDILEGQRTIMNVTVAGLGNDYDVSITFD